MHVLVVDPVESSLEAIGDALLACGHTAALVGSGREVLELMLDDLAPTFDAAAIAWSLPDLSGAEVHVRISEIDRRLADRTLFVSNHPGMWPLRGGGRIVPRDLPRLVARLESLVDDGSGTRRRTPEPIGATMPAPALGTASPAGTRRR